LLSIASCFVQTLESLSSFIAYFATRDIEASRFHHQASNTSAFSTIIRFPPNPKCNPAAASEVLAYEPPYSITPNLGGRDWLLAGSPFPVTLPPSGWVLAYDRRTGLPTHTSRTYSRKAPLGRVAFDRPASLATSDSNRLVVLTSEPLDSGLVPADTILHLAAKHTLCERFMSQYIACRSSASSCT